MQTELTPNLRNIIAGKHIAMLDGLRGFAVLYVLMYHFIPQFSGLIGDIPNVFFKMGWSGVDLFFVLSGFLITGILYKSKDKPHYFRNFYIRRILRIFPIYYLILFLFTVLFPIAHYVPDDMKENFTWYWLYLSNFDTELGIPMHPFLVVAWSLSIEEQYYVVYPTIAYLLSYKNWIRFLTGLIIGSFLLRWIAWLFLDFSPIHIYHFTFTHFDGIAMGGLFRLLVMQYEDYKSFLQKFVRLRYVFLSFMIAISVYCYFDVKINELDHHLSFQPMMFLFGYFFNALTYVSFLLRGLLVDGRVNKIFNNPVLRSAGKYSYAMYLLQYPGRVTANFLIHSTGINFLIHPPNLGISLVIGVFQIAVVYSIAFISWQIYEGPINGLKDRFTKSKSEKSTVVS